MALKTKIKLSQKQLADISANLLFSGCEQSTVSDIIEQFGYFAIFEKGEYIFEPKTSAKQLCIMLDGEALVIRKSSDKEVALNRISENMVFGFASLFVKNENYISYVRATKTSIVLIFEEQNLTHILKQNFEITQNYIAYLTERVRFLNNKINSFIEQCPEVRLACVIYEEYKASGNLQIYANAKKLADNLNISRQTLYRAFDVLEKDGIIKKEYKYIEIKDIGKLKEFLNNNKGN